MLSADKTKPVCVYQDSLWHEEWPPPNVYQTAFSPAVWWVLIGCMCGITATLAFILYKETRLPHTPGYAIRQDMERLKVCDPDLLADKQRLIEYEEHWELSEILLVALGAVCQQGSPRDPTTLAARLLFLTMFMLAVMSYTAFSASVISLVSSVRAPLTTPLELILRRPGAQLVLQDSPFFRRVSSLGPLGPDLYLLPLPEAVTDLMSGRASAVCADRAQLLLHLMEALPADQRCELQLTPFTLPLAPEQLDSKMWRESLRSLEAGLRSRERHLEEVSEPLCPTTTGVISIALRDVWPAPVLLSAGLIGSMLLFVAEHIFSWSDARLHANNNRTNNAVVSKA